MRARLGILLLVLAGCGEAAEVTERRSLTVAVEGVIPGTEDTVCRVVELDNDEPMVVRSIHTLLDPGSHHLILYRTDREPTDSFQSCMNLPGDENTLLIAQQAETSLRYPRGSGLVLPARQRVLIEIHYINYFAAPIDVNATAHFDVVPATDDLKSVSIYFIGPLWLNLPPRSEHRIDSFHYIPEGKRVFAVTTHTHALGTYASLRRAKGVGDHQAVLLHESYDWAEPPLDTFDPALRFERPDGLWLTCMWDNPHDHHVLFGAGFENEMCFLWAYLY
jgi:hypothetical protein